MHLRDCLYISFILVNEAMKHRHSSDYMCSDVGHTSVFDTNIDMIPIIILSYVIFLNYYLCQRVGVPVVSSVYVSAA